MPWAGVYRRHEERSVTSDPQSARHEKHPSAQHCIAGRHFWWLDYVAGDWLNAIASVTLKFQFVDGGLAIDAIAALLVLSGLAYSGTKGTVVSRVVLTFVLV